MGPRIAQGRWAVKKEWDAGKEAEGKFEVLTPVVLHGAKVAPGIAGFSGILS
jgi:hypothetical protein